jgi:hypothetical protein
MPWPTGSKEQIDCGYQPTFAKTTSCLVRARVENSLPFPRVNSLLDGDGSSPNCGLLLSAFC